MRYAIAVLSLGIFLGGCETATDIDAAVVDVRTDQETYSLGDEGLLILENKSGADVEVYQTSEKSGICGMALFQVRAEGEWMSYPDRCIRIMISRFVKLERGNSLAVAFEVGGFESGREYRFVVIIRDPGTKDRSARYSTSFAVTE